MSTAAPDFKPGSFAANGTTCCIETGEKVDCEAIVFICAKRYHFGLDFCGLEFDCGNGGVDESSSS